MHVILSALDQQRSLFLNLSYIFKNTITNLMNGLFPHRASPSPSVERWVAVSRRHVCPGTLNINPCQECLQDSQYQQIPVTL